MLLQPYLFFDGRCEEALEFYKKALGATVESLMRFKECPEPMAPGSVPPGSDDKIMHAHLRIGDSVLLASDGHAGGKPRFEGFGLALPMADAQRAKQVFAALSDGGTVKMPLAKTFFSPQFGMVADRFGVTWMVMVER
jgi:PhnB protein